MNARPFLSRRFPAPRGKDAAVAPVMPMAADVSGTALLSAIAGLVIVASIGAGLASLASRTYIGKRLGS